jgi:hypothetical protein
MRIAWRITTWYLAQFCPIIYNDLIVASRVEPLLYRTLVMMPRTAISYRIPLCSFDKFAQIARSKPPSFLDAVRNVMVLALHSEDMSSADMNIVIRTCPRIENLYIFGSWNLHSSIHPAAPGLDILPLRHLYCNLNRVFDFTAMDPLSHPSFARITHLELFGNLDQAGDSAEKSLARWTGLANLPALTHLALSNSDLLAIFVRILAVCKSLRALVILGRLQSNLSVPEVGILAENPRFVVMQCDNYIADWQRGVLTGNDYWARADAFIAKRMSGEIDCTSPSYNRYWITSPSNLPVIFHRSHVRFGGSCVAKRTLLLSAFPKL